MACTVNVTNVYYACLFDSFYKREWIQIKLKKLHASRFWKQFKMYLTEVKYLTTSFREEGNQENIQRDKSGLANLKPVLKED